MSCFYVFCFSECCVIVRYFYVFILGFLYISCSTYNCAAFVPNKLEWTNELVTTDSHALSTNLHTSKHKASWSSNLPALSDTVAKHTWDKSLYFPFQPYQSVHYRSWWDTFSWHWWVSLWARLCIKSCYCLYCFAGKVLCFSRNNSCEIMMLSNQLKLVWLVLLFCNG